MIIDRKPFQLIKVIIGWIGVLASWISFMLVFFATSFGWALRPAWQSWMVILLYGFVPAVLGTVAMVRVNRNSSMLGISPPWLFVVPFASVAAALIASQFGLWPL